MEIEHSIKKLEDQMRHAMVKLEKQEELIRQVESLAERLRKHEMALWFLTDEAANYNNLIAEIRGGMPTDEEKEKNEEFFYGELSNILGNGK